MKQLSKQDEQRIKELQLKMNKLCRENNQCCGVESLVETQPVKKVGI